MANYLIDAESLLLFHDMSEEERDQLISAAKIRHFAKGDTIFMHGDAIDVFYIVLEGAVRNYRTTPDGKDITLDLCLRGDMVGASHLFEHCSGYRWSAIANEKTTALQYPVEWFKNKVRSSSTLALNLLAAMSHSSHMAAIDAEHLVNFSAPQRVACFILRLCVLYKFDPAGFDFPYSKTTIASKLGMELETFSRTLQTLKKIGVAVQGSHVKIESLHKLECYACGHCSIETDCPTRNALLDMHDLDESA